MFRATNLIILKVHFVKITVVTPDTESHFSTEVRFQKLLTSTYIGLLLTVAYAG